MVMKKIEVFSSCKKALSTAYLYKDCDWSIGRFKMPNKYTAIAFIALYSCTIILQLWYNVGQAFSPQAVAQLLGTTQMLMIYLSLAHQKRLIISTIDKLQETIDNR